MVSRTAPAAPTASSADDLTQRRAIRGRPVETLRESEALKQLREFEQSAFPAPNPLAPDFDEVAPTAATTTATANRGSGPPTSAAGPDYIPAALRSPTRARDEATTTEAALPWLQAVRLPDFPIRWDARVLRYLEFYRSDKRGRAIMSGWLRSQGRWRPMMEDALRRAHLPLGLIYVSMIESGYDPYDRSQAGAVGLWQFLSEGARIYGLRVDYWIDERRDPEKATEAAMRYLGDLKERFGAWPLALAAFNAGYGAVLRAMQKYNTNDYWELCRHEDGLPWDTVLYVPKTMATAVVGENRKLFGYDAIASDAAYAFDAVTVRESLSLAAAAHAAGVSVAELQALNPELRRPRTPPEPWRLRLPRGSGGRFLATYEQHREKVKPFVVRFGERLDDLARGFGLSVQQLRALNGVDDTSEVTPGLTLLVPDGIKPPPPPSLCDTVIVAVPDKDAIVAGHTRLFYRTLPQDGLREVAAFFKVKPVALAQWNHLDLEARLASSMVLQIWVESGFDQSRAALVDPARVRLVTTGSEEFFDLVESKRGRARLSYTVKKGDDLKRIGKKFGLTVADMERINRFGAHHTDLHVGQKITVYREMTKAEKEKAACRIQPSGDRLLVTTPVPATSPASVVVDPDDVDDPPPPLPRPPPVDGRP